MLHGTDSWVISFVPGPSNCCNDPHATGQGVNQFTYYVTNDLAGDWRRLPDIKPKEAAGLELVEEVRCAMQAVLLQDCTHSWLREQIIAARAIKRLVTGNAGSKDHLSLFSIST